MSALTTAAPEVRAAYRHCEQVTRSQARNFAYGIALLPGAQRAALSAVYAYARRIDDIGDGDLPAGLKLAGLAHARSQVAELAAGAPAPADDPVLLALADAGARFPVPLAAFGELIEGCEADVRGTVYETFDQLEHYCRCVAGSIGRLSLGVFGCADRAAAAPLADDLGVALQLTNIIRDIREDLAGGRVYLPAEDLRRFGAVLDPGQTVLDPGQTVLDPGQTVLDPGQAVLDPGPQLTALIGFEAARARDWYRRGLALLPLLDWRSRACTSAMAGIYFRLLGHMEAAPAQVLAHRMSLPAGEKLLVAGRALAGRGPAAGRGQKGDA